MKSALLQDAVGEVRDDFIFDAHRKESYVSKRYSLYSLRRIVAVAAAVMVLFITAVPAMAAMDYEPAYDLLYQIYPAAAQKLKPVHLSCEDNEIQFEVVSAYIDGDELKAYVAVRDLDLDRIDETTDLFDSYSINTPFDCSSSCQNIGYDADSRTATFLISITQWDNKPVPGDKITLRVKKLLCQKNEFDEAIFGLNLSAVQAKKETIKPAYVFGGSGSAYEKYSKDFTALIPQGNLYSPVNGVEITGIGFVEEKLHIQVQYFNVFETDNHGYIYFKNLNGDVIYCAAAISFSLNNEYTDRYVEYVFDLPENNISQYEPFGYFVTSDTLIEGNWSVTFPVESQK